MEADQLAAAVEAKRAKRAAMRRATLMLIVGVGIFDTLMMGVFYLFFKDSPNSQRIFFTVVWTIVTAGLVGYFLRRVRKARFAKYN